jgi:hypothetical protein
MKKRHTEKQTIKPIKQHEFGGDEFWSVSDD